jgi:hypothetical protein
MSRVPAFEKRGSEKWPCRERTAVLDARQRGHDGFFVNICPNSVIPAQAGIQFSSPKKSNAMACFDESANAPGEGGVRK